MNLRTPLIASIAVLSALGGVAAAAIALPTSPPKVNAAQIVPSATPTPEVRTETVRRTIHVVKRDKAVATPVATTSPSAVRTSDDSGHHRSTAVSRRIASSADDSGHHSGNDDSGHHSGNDDSGHHSVNDSAHHSSGDDSGHHGGGDDSGSGHGRGRGRGGDDD
jgi:hypothetical protein